MDDKANSRKPKSTVENVEHRSGYGDMHAHRNAEMMKDHVAQVRAAGLVDEHMAVELLKPLHMKRTWTPEYLSTFPTYTGEQPDMVPLETAERLRRKRDREQLKMVEDFEAGLIDEDGNRIVQNNVDSDDNDAAELGSENSRRSDVTGVEDRIDTRPNTGDKTSALRSRSSSVASASEPDVAVSPPPPPAPPSQSVPAKRIRKRPEKVDPLQPLPGGKDYQAYKYHELVAVGRERRIYTPGNTQGVRNALIQDDINVAQGLERNVAGWKKNVNTYKTFKTKVPDELKTKVSDDLDGNEDEEEEQL